MTGYEVFIVELVDEETDDGLEAPSPFSSVLSSLSSLSYISGLNGLPSAPDTGGKYPGRAPGKRLPGGLKGPPKGCPA